ncbi:dihydroneopterin aldolase [Myxococcota bacterium]|nr:dihydroneopterin aldolase [Myxococcota bacterium]
MPPPDEIFLEGLRFTGYHGYFEYERRQGCQFEVDLTLTTSIRAAAASDQLSQTLDYGAVAETVLKANAAASHKLIERLAEGICAAVLRAHPAQAITLTLRKLNPPVQGGATASGVRITRRREDLIE